MKCPKCGNDVDSTMMFCPYCGFDLSSLSTPPDFQNIQKINGNSPGNQYNPAGQYPPAQSNNVYVPSNAYPYPPLPQKKKSHVGAIIAVIIVLLILFALLTQTVPGTGTVKVKYKSILGNDVKVYIDGEYKGTVTSDEYHSFYGISPGTHIVEVRDLNDNFLGKKSVEVNAGSTTTVEISFGSS